LARRIEQTLRTQSQSVIAFTDTQVRRLSS
jgi:hypothetical protein